MGKRNGTGQWNEGNRQDRKISRKLWNEPDYGIILHNYKRADKGHFPGGSTGKCPLCIVSGICKVCGMGFCPVWYSARQYKKYCPLCGFHFYSVFDIHIVAVVDSCFCDRYSVAPFGYNLFSHCFCYRH